MPLLDFLRYLRPAAVLSNMASPAQALKVPQVVHHVGAAVFKWLDVVYLKTSSLAAESTLPSIAVEGQEAHLAPLSAARFCSTPPAHPASPRDRTVAVFGFLRASAPQARTKAWATSSLDVLLNPDFCSLTFPGVVALDQSRSQ